ncbi:TetR/AcrR family transcriptional regulator [Methylobacterium sp. ap11]|uniref:TetR/AcrR family transcriptional regulator n=1 Tax=Methylobacterium sp. ap11 TaxID=1761799 RepID=UPI000B22960B|nr:TetR/AcrR family transcriptional regulator [Methylobacterium sp. ap11]
MRRDARRPGGRPWSFDREAALETAMLLFWRHGYEGVSVGDLTKAIGIAPPSLYAAFGSKAGLYRAALARYEEMPGRLDLPAVAAAGSLPEAVRLLLEGAVAAVTHRERERGCMVSSGLVACHPDHAALAREAGERRETLRRRIAQSLAAFAPPDRAERLARHLSAAMQGISIQARDGVSREDLREIVEEVVAGVAARAAAGA